MRIINGVLALLLILFAVAQYNDPDGVFWAAVYGASALWCAVAALRPAAGGNGGIMAVFGLSCLAAMAGTVWFWPKTPNWWMQDVWWETETAREGMGMMIIVVSLLVAGIALLKGRRTA